MVGPSTLGREVMNIYRLKMTGGIPGKEIASGWLPIGGVGLTYLGRILGFRGVLVDVLFDGVHPLADVRDAEVAILFGILGFFERTGAGVEGMVGGVELGVGVAGAAHASIRLLYFIKYGTLITALLKTIILWHSRGCPR